MSEHTLFWNAQQQPAGGVRVTIAVPPSWSTQVDAMGSPQFGVPDVRGPGPTIAVVHAPGADDRARLEWAISRQYPAAQLAEASRETRPDGRIWIVHRRKSGHVHARMFLPASAAEAVVMFIALLQPGQDDHLGDIELVADTLTLTP